MHVATMLAAVTITVKVHRNNCAEGWARQGRVRAHLLHAVQRSHVVQRVQRRRQATVQAEYLRDSRLLSATLTEFVTINHSCVKTQLRRGVLARKDGPLELSGPHSTCSAAPVAVATGKGGFSDGVVVGTLKVRTWFSTSAVSGRKSKRSVKYFHTFALPYFLRHSS